MAVRYDPGIRVETSELVIPDAEIVHPKAANFWGVMRFFMGFTFLWAFLDKLFALGFSTGRDPATGSIDFFGPAAWIKGGSPTDGVLQFGIHSKAPFRSFYEGLAGSAWVEWFYMITIAAIGIALMFGIFTRLAAIGGILWMAIFYTATAMWPEHNPVLDDHILSIIVLAGIAYVGAGRFFGFGKWWRKTQLVQRYPIFE
jgi:thiosulfate dehydrogenase [quinone] large subunit